MQIVTLGERTAAETERRSRAVDHDTLIGSALQMGCMHALMAGAIARFRTIVESVSDTGRRSGLFAPLRPPPNRAYIMPHKPE